MPTPTVEEVAQKLMDLKRDKIDKPSDVVVYETTDYDALKPHAENRPLDPKRIAEIVADYHNGHDYFRDHPIIVSSTRVIQSGHHRHAAARIAQAKLYYIVDDKFTLQDAIHADTRTKNWGSVDHLNRYADMGNPEYIKLRDLLKKHSWLTLTKGMRLISTKGHKGFEFNNGLFVADRVRFAERVCNMLLDFKPYHKFWDRKQFIDAVMQLAVQPDYDHERMMKKMGYASVSLEQRATMQQYLDAFTTIYNRREPENRHAHFHKYVRLLEDATE